MARVFTDGAATQQLASASMTLTSIDSFSVAFWLYRTATPAAQVGLVGADEGSIYGFSITLTAANLIEATQLYSTAYKIRDSSTAPALNTWVHVVVVHNHTGTATTDFTFYFDGKSEAGTAGTTGSGSRAQVAVPFRIGQGVQGLLAPPANIGPVAIWSRPISGAECLALASGAHPTRFREGLIETFDLSAAHGEEGWLQKLYLVAGATIPTSAAVSPAVESPPLSILETRQNVRPMARSRARYNAVTAAAVYVPYDIAHSPQHQTMVAQ